MRPFRSWRGFAATPTLLIAAALTAACDDSNEITAPEIAEPPGLAGTHLGSGAVIYEAVRGSGHLPIEGPQKIRVFTFEASKLLDGTVSGSFELRRAPGGVSIGGDVACFDLFPGNEAWIGGIVRSVTDPGIEFIVGWAAAFHVLDAGEAPGAGPDQITLIQFFEDAAVATAFCEQRDGIEGYDLGLMDIAAGSVQVGRVGRADIVYAGERGVTAMNADGSGQSVVALSGAYPEWSPDGKWIAFMSDRDGDAEIYVIRPDGSDVTQLTFNDGPDGEPNWRR